MPVEVSAPKTTEELKLCTETPPHRTATLRAATPHIPELDALRGVAALVVVLNHYHQALLRGGAPHWLSRPKFNPLLWMVVDGHPSVIMFFLLSGFVLTLPYLRGPHPPYGNYLLRRVVRIYPAYLASLLLSVLLCSLLVGTLSLGDTIATVWPHAPDTRTVMQHLAMLGRFDVLRFDGPVWSLVHEARISLIMPLLALLAMRMRLRTAMVAGFAVSLVASFLQEHYEGGLHGGYRFSAWSDTLTYCGIFLMGAALARHQEACRCRLRHMVRSARVAWVVGALALYLYVPSVPHLAPVMDFLIACASMVLLAHVMDSTKRVAGILRTWPMQYAGRISYSLYLIHVPVLAVLCWLGYGHISLLWLLPLYLVCSVAMASVLYVCVERPSILLSRRLKSANLTAWIEPAAAELRPPQLRLPVR